MDRAKPGNAIPLGFVGYSFHPPLQAETIKEAIVEINRSQQVFLKSWEDMNIAGQLLIDEICREIDRCDFFVADVTTLNHNVLYELGYAIAKNKPVWLLFDDSIDQAKHDWRDFSVLQTVGYRSSTNTQRIVTSFYTDSPHLQASPLGESLLSKPSATARQQESLLLLKPNTSTNIVGSVENALRLSSFSVVLDDPRETPVQTLAWYAQELSFARAIVAVLESTRRANAATRNARISLAAGMAHGFGKDVLMIVEGDFASPLDYKDRLKIVKTAAAAKDCVRAWLAPLEANVAPTSVRPTASALRHPELRDLWLGDYVAENEEEALRDGYFVETSAYSEAARGDTHTLLFVGRKGTGKTANFVKLRAHLESDRRNTVVSICPSFLDLASLVAVLQGIPKRDRKTHVIESLWRLLLFSEVSGAVSKTLRERPVAALTSDESAYLNYLAGQPTFAEPDFAARLERFVGSLVETAFGGNLEAFRESVAEKLNLEVIPELRRHIATALPRKGSLVILADNLDKTWDSRADLEVLSEFLLGLLRAAHKVANELATELGDTTRGRIRLVVFMRADIFERIKQVAREPDKLRTTHIRWTDHALLLRVLDERIKVAAHTEAAPLDLWSKFFCDRVGQQPSREYVLEQVLPRPRDMLYFTRTAVSTAIDRGHKQVEEDDLVAAAKVYSEFALDVFRIEDASTGGNIADALINLAGAPRAMTTGRLREALSEVSEHVAHQDDAAWEAMVARLIGVGVLEVEVSAGVFRSDDLENEIRKLLVMARRLVGGRFEDVTVRLHRAFATYLEME